MVVALEPNSPCNSHSKQTNKHLWVQWHELNVRKYEHVQLQIHFKTQFVLQGLRERRGHPVMHQLGMHWFRRTVTELDRLCPNPTSMQGPVYTSLQD